MKDEKCRSDEELMGLLQKGEAEAFEVLFRRYRGRIMSFACQYLFDFQLAEDVFQETFIRVFRHATRYTPGRKVSSWIYAIAANLCRDRLRKRRASGRLKDALRISESILAPPPAPGRRIEEMEASATLRKAMAKLSPEHRSALMLHAFHGFKYREISDIVRCPVGTVRSRIHYAVRRLHEIMQSLGEGA